MTPKFAEAPPTAEQAQLAQQLVKIVRRRDINEDAKMQLALNAVTGFIRQNPMQFDKKTADHIARSLTPLINALESNRSQFTGDAIAGKMFKMVKGSTQRQMGYEDSVTMSNNAMAIQRKYEGILDCLKRAQTYAESLRDRDHAPEDKSRYVTTLFTNLDAAAKLADGMGANFMKLSEVYERSAQRTDTEFKTSAAISAAVGILVGGWAIGAALGVGVAGAAAIGATTGALSEAAVVGITQKRLISPKEALQAALLGAVFSGAGKAATIAKSAKAAKVAHELHSAESVAQAAGVPAGGLVQQVGTATASGGYRTAGRVTEKEEAERKAREEAARARKRRK